MTKYSNLVFRNITCIDHAFIDDEGFIQGGSFHQEAIVGGPIEEKEQVVIDFSKCKKLIKARIDDDDDGFDHKLWVLDGFSMCNVLDYGDKYKIVTPNLEVILAKDAVKFINYIPDTSLEHSVATQISKEVEAYLQDVMNDERISCSIILSTEGFVSRNGQPSYFTYWHGLKNSSSWGCQNIAHGHTSFVEVYNSSGARVWHVEEFISTYLDGAMVVNKNDVEDNTLSYESFSRGSFELTFSDDVKTVFLDTDSTVENIVEHICSHFADTLKKFDVRAVMISEGLQKGSVKFYD